MKKTTFAILFFITVCFLKAQTGTLIVSGFFYEQISDTLRCVVLKNDSIVQTKTSSNPYYFVFDSLPAGKYSIKIYDNAIMKKWYENVVVNAGVNQLRATAQASPVVDSLLGELSIVVTDDDAGHQHYTFKLFRGDTQITSRNYNHAGYMGFDQLVPGNYTLQIDRDGDLLSLYRHIHIFAGETTELSVTVYDFQKTKRRIPFSTEAIVLPFAVYGNPLITGDKSNPVAGNIKTGVLVEGYYGEGKHVNAGFQVGGSIDMTSIANEWDTTILPGRKRENYFGGNYTLGFMLKLTPYNFHAMTLDDKMHKLFVDVGIQYNLPVLFHHVSGSGTRIVKTRFIHQFKDVTAIARIGFRNIALTAEYRIFDYFLGNFPELPRVKVGLSFPIYN